MSQFPSLPLFTDAFLADTGHLNAQETGAYLLLLMMAWRSPGCRIPDDDARMARWARVDLRTWRRIKSAVMEFWALEDGFWTQKRLSKEREIVSKRAEVARQNGVHGGRPKSLENNDTGNPAGSSRVTQKKAPNPNPISKEEYVAKATSQNETEYRDARDELWRRGLPILSRITGKPADKLRSLVGDYVKRAEDDASLVLHLIDKAAADKVIEPIAWITKGIAARTSPDPKPMTFRQIDQAEKDRLRRRLGL